MLHLPDVTLFAVSAANLALTQRALEISQSKCRFGDALFMTNSPHTNNKYRTEIIPSFEKPSETVDFALTHIAKHVETSFLLCIQWDGYVINPDCWSQEFLKYDYIGAKWPWHAPGQNVGNGGFCLRSHKFFTIMENLILSGEIDLPGEIPEDDYVCRLLRPKLENLGIVFAPEYIADMFSYERSQPGHNTFGFHGVFNMWRHTDYSELESIVFAMDDYVVMGSHYTELERTYLNLGRFDIAEMMANRRAACQNVEVDEG